MTKPEALQAFLSPKSRILQRNNAKEHDMFLDNPQEWAQKIATVLHPGPPFYSRLDNSDLIQTLGDARIMNCVTSRAQSDAAMERRRYDAMRSGGDGDDVNAKVHSGEGSAEPWLGVGTIWSSLDSLPVGAKWGEIALGSAGDASAAATKTAGKDSDEEDDGLWSSVCFSVDMQGNNVALEKSVVVPSDLLTTHHFFNGNQTALAAIGVGGKHLPHAKYHWDDFSAASGNAGTTPTTVAATAFPLYSPITVNLWEWPSWMPFLGKDKTPDAGGADKPGSGDKKGVKRVWIPSTTKVSFQAHWWGYTLYLPTPVMAELGKDADNAEQIASTISKMLMALLSGAAKLPLPPALSTILTILKSIAPVTNYIASFIGWSWDELKSHDKGQGICLSATWILPVALIPRDWDAPAAPPDTDGDGKPDGPPQAAPAPSKPDGDAKQPAGGDKQPDGGDKQPVDGGKQPDGGDKQPANGGKQPEGGDKQPTEPAKGGEQPKQPSQGQPAAGGDDKKPDANAPANDKQPANNDKPADGKTPQADKPVNDIARPVGDKPKDAQPVADKPNDPAKTPNSGDNNNSNTDGDDDEPPKDPQNRNAHENYPLASSGDTKAPANQGSQPLPADAIPDTIDPALRKEYPKNMPDNEKPAPVAGVPAEQPKKAGIKAVFAARRRH